MNLKSVIPKFDNGGKTLGVNEVQGIINHYSGGKSPLTAQDFINASNTYGVPVQLLLAQSILESNIGTKGAAVKTKNVGNVGNNSITGKRTNQGSWVNGLNNYAKLMATQYNAKSKADILRLVETNFYRPVGGGHYAPETLDYGMRVYNLIQKIDKHGDWGPVQQKSSNGGYSNPDVGMQPFKANLIDDSAIKKALEQGMDDQVFDYISNNFTVLPKLDQGTMDWYENYKGYKQQLAEQEAEQKRIESMNKELLTAVAEKQAKNQNFLNSFPDYGYVSSSYRDGGMLKNLDPDIVGFYRELRSIFPDARITSGYRPGARTKSGKVSRHARGQAVDIAHNPNIHKFLYSSQGDALLRKHRLGFLDETIKINMVKTGGTGPHYHIGKDFLGNSSRLNTAYRPISSIGASAGKTNGSYIESGIPTSDDYYFDYVPDYSPGPSFTNPINVVGSEEHFNSFLQERAKEEAEKQSEVEQMRQENDALVQTIQNNKYGMLNQFKRFMPTIDYIKSEY